MIHPQFPTENANPVSPRVLRQFAALCLGIFGLSFAWSCCRHAGAPTVAAWTGLVAAIGVGVPGLVCPAGIRPIYLAAFTLTRPLGHVLGLTMLALIYYGVLTPLAFAFRLCGRQMLDRQFGKASSYWIPKLPSPERRRYLHQYQKESMVPLSPPPFQEGAKFPPPLSKRGPGGGILLPGEVDEAQTSKHAA